MSESLWPNFEPEILVSPQSILKEQAAALSKLTKNALLGEVIVNADRYSANDGTARFMIVSPTFGMSFLCFTLRLYQCIPLLLKHSAP
jgi:hypothetical protein